MDLKMIEVIREIERLASDEISQPGTIEDRYRVLKAIQATAWRALAKVRAEP